MRVRQFGPKKNTTIVYGYPLAGTLGSHVLLKEHYRKHDVTSWRRQVVFSIKFLRRWKQEHGDLQCCFCGQEHLEIDTPSMPVPNGVMATVDHFIPQADGIDPKEEANLVVACRRCNKNKKNKRYELETLNFIPTSRLNRLKEWESSLHMK